MQRPSRQGVRAATHRRKRQRKIVNLAVLGIPENACRLPTCVVFARDLARRFFDVLDRGRRARLSKESVRVERSSIPCKVNRCWPWALNSGKG